MFYAALFFSSVYVYRVVVCWSVYGIRLNPPGRINQLDRILLDALQYNFVQNIVARFGCILVITFISGSCNVVGYPVYKYIEYACTVCCKLLLYKFLSPSYVYGHQFHRMTYNLKEKSLESMAWHRGRTNKSTQASGP